MKDDFTTRLKEGADLLERTEAAPRWLAMAVRVGVAHARILAPNAPTDNPPPDFYYPH